jgi:hypothetical protein
MKKENIIVSVIILFIVVGYFVFLTVNQMKKEENVFLSRQSVEYESLANPLEEKPIMRYKDREFTFRDLPLGIQQRIKNEQIASHKKIQLILKDFLVRFHKIKKIEKDKTIEEIKVETLPPLADISDARIKAGEVDRIYNLNKDRLPKDHDPDAIKKQIKLELLTNEAYNYVLALLTDVYKNADASLPAAPAIPEEWLLTDDIMASYGPPDAINHLIWISDYACKYCGNYTSDLGLLLQKYSSKELRVTFIPWTKNDIDIFAYLNVAAVCLLKNTDKDTFWRFHSLAMTGNKKITDVEPDNLKVAKAFLEENLKEAQVSEADIEKVKKCASNLDEKHETLIKLVKLKRKLQFIPEIKSPTLFLNGRLLDLEGITLFKAIDKELTHIMSKATKN